MRAVAKVCAEPGCPAVILHGTRCHAHRRPKARNGTSWNGQRDRVAQARFRRAVLALYDGRCAAIVDGIRCDVSDPAALEAHHLQPGNDDPATGVLLCKAPPLGRGHHKEVDPHAR